MTHSTKQMIRRLSLVGGMVALGAIGLAQTQRYFFAGEDDVAQEANASQDIDLGIEQGIPMGDEDPAHAGHATDGSPDNVYGGGAYDQPSAPAGWQTDTVPGDTVPGDTVLGDTVPGERSASARNPMRSREGVVPAGAEQEQPADDWGDSPQPLADDESGAPSFDNDQPTELSVPQEPAPLNSGFDETPPATLDDSADYPAPATPDADPTAITAPDGGLGDAQMFDAPPTAAGQRGETGNRLRTTEPTTAVPITPQADGLGSTGKPGPRELEGPQAPALTIEKTGPGEIQVGRPATFTVRVRNVGQVTAQQVIVQDEIPHGTSLISTKPQATTSDGALLWQLGTIKPGEEVTTTVELMPEAEGQIGSVANVTFQAAATARANVTRPKLELQMTAPARVLIGENVVFSIRLSNPGTGVAERVVLEEDVPSGLRHAAGRQLEYEVGRLNPGESRQLELTLTADQAGILENVLTARAEGGLQAEQRAEMEITAPKLQLEVNGPTRRYLDRPGTYSIVVANPGTAPAKGLALVAHLPRGLKFVNTNNRGVYDDTSHSVHWSLEELPAGEQGTVQITALPIEMGEHKLRIEGQAQMGLAEATEKPVIVEGIAALEFDVTDLQDPVEVEGQTTYEIRVRNQGSKTAVNVRVSALVPDGMRYLNGEGATRAVVQQQQVVFEPLAELRPQAEATFRVQVQATDAGDKRFQAQVISDEVTKPVTTEESTVVYADE